MADYGSLTSPTEKFKRPTLSFFNSPRLFTNFASKPFFETEPAAMSPTSILDSKAFSAFRNPFRSEPPKAPDPPEPKRHWLKLDSRGIGLGIVDALTAEKSNPKTPNPETRIVVFGSQLKIQIPPAGSPAGSPKSPASYGIKERSSEVGSLSPAARKSDPGSSPRVMDSGSFSAGEMELSEDYTCVIAHGPNPRTTHIFDDCVIETYYGAVDYWAPKKEYGLLGGGCSFPSESFLSFCHACKKHLGQGKDIYMYRGEKAFCSRECRYQQMLMDEEMEKLDSDDVHALCS